MIRNVLAVALLLLILMAGGWFTWQGLTGGPKINAELQQRIAASSISRVYELNRDQWMEFSIEPETHHIRIVTNANLSSSLVIRPEDVWKYSLAIELLDSKGKLLLAREYHQRATMTKIRDLKFEKEITPSFYLNMDLIPADGKLFILNLSPYAGAAKLRVRLGPSDPAVMSASFRAYVPQKLAEYKLARQWQKLSDQDKKQADQGNVYGHELLLDTEIANLLRKQEMPLAPSGILGRSYKTLSLYVMRDYEGRVVDTPILPAGVLVDRELKGILAIPEQGGQVRLEFAATGVDAPPVEGASIHIRWIGRGPLERASRDEIWHSVTLQINQAWQGGLLEITAPGQLVVRAYLTVDGREQEITPQPMYTRIFVAGPSEPIIYPIEHLGAMATPFRVDFRSFAGEAADQGSLSSPMVRYELLDRKGGILRSGTILVAAPLSQYERLATDLNGLRISDPGTYYFSLPASVASVRLSADKRMLVSAYNRPFDLVHEIKVPEDAYVAAADAFRQPAWFQIRPLEYDRLLLDNHSVLLILQSRPPEDQPDLMSGRYMWEDYHPQGAWIGRHLFTPEQDRGHLREEVRQSLYRSVMPGRDQLLELRGVEGEWSIQPTLLVLKKPGAPSRIQVTVDGSLHHQATAAAAITEIPLPMLAAGIHRVRVDGSAHGRYYLNYAGMAPGSLLRRLSNRFDGQALSFIYERRERCKETLSARLYVPYGTSLRSQVLVSVSLPTDIPIGPLRDWVFDKRRYDIRPDSTVSVPVAGTSGQLLDRGQPFFFPLGEDLPTGRYRFDFLLEQGVPGYITFSKITPGLVEQRRISVEQEIRNVKLSE